MLELQILGNIGQDAQVRETNGRRFVTFSVCHDESYIDQNGTKVSRSVWVDCSMNNDGGKIVGYLRKGMKVFVRGNAAINTFKNSQGQWGANLRCTNCRVELCGQAGQQTQQPQQQPQQSQPAPIPDFPPMEEPKSELPF